jgi:glutathione S-transferase
MNRSLDVATSWTASALRLGAGMYTRKAKGALPGRLLELYEFEGCPHCRRVREALSELDLPAKIIPCPKGGPLRERAIAAGGKARFPLLVDPNTDARLYEASTIIAYLYERYGVGRPPIALGPLTKLSSGLTSALRARRGRRARPSRPPEKPLRLWSFEASPYCRIVRERLSELSLEYELVNIGKHGRERPAFRARHGKVQVPYLEDPNTGVAMFESADIVAYLERTYAP